MLQREPVDLSEKTETQQELAKMDIMQQLEEANRLLSEHLDYVLYGGGRFYHLVGFSADGKIIQFIKLRTEKGISIKENRLSL